MSYYSDNDWRYYSEDYLEHASLRDKWNDLMSKTTVDDKIKGAYEGAKNAVGSAISNAGRAAESFRRSDTAHRIHSNVTSATRPIRNAGRAIGAAASNAASAVSGAASNAKSAVSGAGEKVHNMFGRVFEWPNGNNSSLYNSIYYQTFKKRILAKQKEYRQRIRDAVAKSENKVDDKILGAVDKAVSNARYGLHNARRNVRTAVDLAGRNSKRALDNAVNAGREAIETAGNRLERSARGVVPGMAMTEYRADQRRREDARNNYQQSRREAGGSQRRNSNRG